MRITVNRDLKFLTARMVDQCKRKLKVSRIALSFVI